MPRDNKLSLPCSSSSSPRSVSPHLKEKEEMHISTFFVLLSLLSLSECSSGFEWRNKDMSKLQKPCYISQKTLKIISVFSMGPLKNLKVSKSDNNKLLTQFLSFCFRAVQLLTPFFGLIRQRGEQKKEREKGPYQMPPALDQAPDSALPGTLFSASVPRIWLRHNN